MDFALAWGTRSSKRRHRVFSGTVCLARKRDVHILPNACERFGPIILAALCLARQKSAVVTRCAYASGAECVMAL
eukprot:9500969-Pyramimonas_sp.AAC.1